MVHLNRASVGLPCQYFQSTNLIHIIPNFKENCTIQNSSLASIYTKNTKQNYSHLALACLRCWNCLIFPVYNVNKFNFCCHCINLFETLNEIRETYYVVIKMMTYLLSAQLLYLIMVRHLLLVNHPFEYSLFAIQDQRNLI